MKILVTGVAGFIGYHTAERLMNEGHEVVGIDNLNDYYDVSLKHARLNRLAHHVNFVFEKFDLADREATAKFFAGRKFDRVIHLAAQAGVRYSVDHPAEYIDRNVVAFGNVLEGCRAIQAPHLVYASSSSIYGLNEKTPFSIHDAVDHPVSLYAATKRADELMAHVYSHLYNVPTTGLRFFTVYGPWDRPDMALQSFATKISRGESIEVYNNGELIRDWTFVDDIVQGILKAMETIPERDETNKGDDPATSWAPFRIYNLGGGNPVKLIDFIRELERALGKTAEIIFKPMRPEDVLVTHADASDTMRDLDFKPSVELSEGVPKFAAWFLLVTT
ncbi:MAG: SDR family NAD(P)-dependent oxidoreductase [Candidatus Magasanikbacteria bacterium]|nr:SDR family NAD(P)-dependent oxidoreductase [Candidatus Magasanikbacteria bacterium]